MQFVEKLSREGHVPERNFYVEDTERRIYSCINVLLVLLTKQVYGKDLLVMPTTVWRGCLVRVSQHCSLGQVGEQALAAASVSSH
jgi:hypothetical protein